MSWVDLSDRWPSRLRAVAQLIPPGSSVLDLGAGAQGLRVVLDPSCRYTPADLQPRSYDSLVLDMDDAATWPHGHWDVAVMAGVLEYSANPGPVLSRLRSVADRAVLTYAHHLRRRPVLEADEFAALAESAGWIVRRADAWRGQVIWELS